MTETPATYTVDPVRHYIIQDNDGLPLALIQARSPAGALAHYTAMTLTVRWATTSDVLSCVRVGIDEQHAVVNGVKREE